MMCIKHLPIMSLESSLTSSQELVNLMCESFEAAVVMERETRPSGWATKAPDCAPQHIADSLEFQSSQVLSKRVDLDPCLPDSVGDCSGRYWSLKSLRLELWVTCLRSSGVLSVHSCKLHKHYHFLFLSWCRNVQETLFSMTAEFLSPADDLSSPNVFTCPLFHFGYVCSYVGRAQKCPGIQLSHTLS